MNDNNQTTQVKKQTICRKRKLCIAIIFMNKNVETLYAARQEYITLLKTEKEKAKFH